MDFRVSYCSVYNWSDTVLNLSYASWSRQSTDKKLRAPQVPSGRSWTTWAHHGFYALCLSLGRHLEFLTSKGWKRINNKDQMPRKSAFRTWRVHTFRPRRWEMLPHLTTYRIASHADVQLNCQNRNTKENSNPQSQYFSSYLFPLLHFLLFVNPTTKWGFPS